MKKLSKEEKLRDTVKKGVKLLHDEKTYKQSSLVKKMKTLNYVISAPSLSNIVKDKEVGIFTLQAASKGILEIIDQELGLEYNADTQTFQNNKKAAWEPYIIPEGDGQGQIEPSVAFHLEGRVSIQHKTDFIASAQKEIIEVGVRLKTFSEYFTSRNEKEYKAHIISLLQKGVAVKCYLLDPDSNEARLYFDDRARAQSSESDAIAETKKVVERLKTLLTEIKQMGLPGAFEIYLYKHIPYNHFLVVDTKLAGGKMMVSHYIYGVRRAECPVWEFTKKEQPNLFKKYAESLQLYLQDAKLL
jgi:hypothetical protein